MSKPETTFYTSVHKHLTEDVYCMKNSNPYVGGVPDCWYSGPKDDLWVEYKFVVLPKRSETAVPIELSDLQKKWLTGRYAEGRNVAVILGCKEGGIWLPGTTWDRTFTLAAVLLCLEARKNLAAHISQVCSHGQLNSRRTTVSI